MLWMTPTTLWATSAEEPADSTPHWGLTLSGGPSRLLVMDKYQRYYQKERKVFSFEIQANHISLPSDSDAFARDYDFPTFSIGMRYAINHVTMRREERPTWGLAEMVDYDSQLGNQAALYLLFTRPFFRHRHWSADYTLGTGLGYSPKKYSKTDNVDNELIGSRFLIYFTAGLHATWRFAPDWGLRVGADFYHLSNGALNRPNKGANVLGPSVGLQYFPYYEEVLTHGRHTTKTPFKPYLFARATVGVGGKVLNEDWLLTQFHTSPDAADYRTGRFHFYTAYSLQADLMCRYARRWASGVGLDVFYGTYASRVKTIDEQNGVDRKHSPLSVGVALKHTVYYHRLALDAGLGVYLYRHMGENAAEIEKPYYERIGLSYAIPSLGGLAIGACVKAHLTKADFTELTLSMPFTLK